MKNKISTPEALVTGMSICLGDPANLNTALALQADYLTSNLRQTDTAKYVADVVEFVGVTCQLPVAFFKCSDTSIDLQNRLVSSISQLELAIIASDKMDEGQRQLAKQAEERLANAPLDINVKPSITIDDITSGSRRLYRTYDGLGIILIDGLHLVVSRENGVPVESDLSGIKLELAALAAELRTPIIATYREPR
jgi:replicative DNA helicase